MDLSNRSEKLSEILESENLDCSTDSTVLSQQYKKYNGIINWHVKKSDLNFNTFGASKECQFSIGSPDYCKLCLRIFPCGITENTNDFVSLSLCFRSPLPISSWCQCMITFSNESGEILKSDAKSTSGEDLNVIDFRCFTQKSKLKEFCSNSKLIIQCIVNISSSSFYCKTDNLERSIQESHEMKSPPKLFFDKIPSDVNIKIENEFIPVNKALLASEIPALRILFNALHEAKKEFSIPKHLLISASVFKDIVHFVYTGNIWFKNFKHACEVYDSACLFKMVKLKAICSAYISANLHENNIFLAQAIAQKFTDTELLDACYEFIKKCDTENLTHLSMLSFDEILQK